MPTDDDYGRRERLLLHQHTATQFGPASTPSSQSQPQAHSHSHTHSHTHSHIHTSVQNPSASSSGFDDHQPVRYGSASASASAGVGGIGGGHRQLQERYEKPLANDQQQQQQHQQLSSSDVYGAQNHLQERYSQLPGLQGLQGYHQFGTGAPTVGRLALGSDRFSIYGDQVVAGESRNPDQQRYQHAIGLGERFLHPGPKDEEHYATPGGLLLSSELFPSPPSPAPANDRFIPPPPLSPTPSEKYASSQSLSGYHQDPSDHVLLPSGSPSAKDRFGTAPASPMPSAKERFASAERLLANSSPVLQGGSQGIFATGVSQQTKEANRYSLSSERLLSSSPIHAPVPERFASGGSRSSEKLQSSPRHERGYHHVQEAAGGRDRYSGSGSERYLSSSPNPEGAHQRYSSSERVPDPQTQPSRRYSSTSDQQRYGNVGTDRTGGSPSPCVGGNDYGGGRMEVQSSSQHQRYPNGDHRFGEILAQRYGQSRVDRFVVSAEHLAPASSSERLLSSGSPSNSTNSNGPRYHGGSGNYATSTSQTSPCNDSRFSSGSGSSSGLSPTPETTVNRYGSQTTQKNNCTEKYFTLSKSTQNYTTDRYQSPAQAQGQERSSRLDRFHNATNSSNSVSNASGTGNDSRYSPGRGAADKSYLSLPKPKDRFPSTGRVVVQTSGCNSVTNDRAYASAHTPVERYVPQPPPEILYPGYVDLYVPPSAHTPTDRYVPAADPGDPYMRRDLGFHHHYRLPPPGYPYHHQSHFRFRGFAYAPPSRLGGSPGSSSSTSSTNSAQREFSTSPLLRPKARVSAVEFSGQPRIGGPQNHGQCCSDQNQQGPNTQRSCCPTARRSLPTCAAVAASIANITNQNNQPHTSWQPSPGSGTTSTSTVSSSGQDGGIGTSQSISMYAVGTAGSVNANANVVPNANANANVNVNVNANLNMNANVNVNVNVSGNGNGNGNGGGSNKTTDSPPNNSTTISPPVPLTATGCSNLARSASAPTGPRPVLTAPSFISQTSEIQNQRFQRPLSRTDAIKNYIKRETATFFGVDEDSEAQEKQRWLERRRRMASRKYGALLPEHRPPDPDITRDVPDSTEIPEGVTLRRWHQPVRRKDSVARMTLSGLSYMVTTMTRHRPRERDETRPESRSFPPSTVPVTPTSPEVTADEEEESFFQRPPPPSPAPNQQNEQGVPAGSPEDVGVPGTIREDLTTSGVTDLVDAPPSTERDVSEELVRFAVPKDEGISSSEILSRRPRQISRDHYTSRTSSWRRSREPGAIGVQAPQGEAVTLRRQAISGTRISPNRIDRIFDNSNRRQYGMGIVGRFFGQSFRKSVAHKPDVKKQLDDIEDQRPFFTYWITTVQVLILVISLACYGFGPFGFELNHRSGLVLVTSLSLQQVDYQEPANFWIGPRAADLIHLGAKFAPCMRRDIKILKEIDVWRERERDTACCIRNDDSGCVQSSKQDCSNTISTWKKWGQGDNGPGGRISGSVCGLDPKFCDAPASIAPYEWPDDITKWPICRKTNPFNQRFSSKGSGNQMFPVGRHMDKMAEHMVCEVIGHPCCIGIHGMCRITTKEYCDFVYGYFHEEASLCSQVECLHDVCGMIPFLHPEWPDQFYRLFTSIFLHAGIFHLAITLCVQYFFMRDLEKLTGSFRIAIIYFTGGLAGNLASAIFVPYRAEVGPAGAHFALLATLVVEVLNSWPMLKYPRRALMKLLASLFALLLLGALPWIDNYAHLFGFVFGFLAAYAVMPFISFGKYDRRRKILLVWVCLILIVGLFAMLLALFYNVPVYECEICKLFTCIPFTKDFCASQNINFKREEPV